MYVKRLDRRRGMALVLVALIAALLPLVGAGEARSAGATVFINELHYDNVGTDIGEAIEIAGPAGTDLTDWSIALYNGNGGAVYNTRVLAGTLADDGTGFGFQAETYPTNGIQNGSPDGIALVDDAGTVVEFISYEGSFAAVGGPADGMASVDIGVSEGSSTTIGTSLQQGGTGSMSGDFTWETSQAETFGTVNIGQSFGGGAPLVVTCDPSADTVDGTPVSAGGTATDGDDIATFVASSVTPATSEIAVSFTNTSAVGGTSTAQVDASSSLAVGVYTVELTASNTAGDTSSCTIEVEVLELVPIYDIQGATHYSPFADDVVATTGIVTAISFSGFYAQDPDGDGDPATSNGLFVFMGNGFVFDPSVAVGDGVQMVDRVSEFIPGGASTGNLSTTQMAFADITVLSSGNPLPAPSVIGRSGRIPPAVLVIDPAKEPVNLQDPADAAATPFTPDTDGIDFYESLEGMLVTVEDAVTVSAIRAFGSFSSEFWVLANKGKDVEPRHARTQRGGIELQPDPDNRGDQNPERVQIQFDASPTTTGTLYPGSAPVVKVGDRVGNVTGVMGYSFGNFEVNATELIDLDAKSLKQETTHLRGSRTRVTVASYNVLNLSPLPEDDNQRATLATQVVNNLRSPDVIALQEIQDNNGTTDDGTTDATLTLEALRDAIIAAGGPTYSFCNVAPEDGTSGGVPGGNIRNAFFWNAQRVTEVVPCSSLDEAALTAIGVTDPTAFAGTRNPLVGVFERRGEQITVINNHLTSRFGSTPIFGGPQPFVQAGEDERETQTATLNEVVDSLLAADRKAKIAIVGDLNTFQWTNDLAEILPGTGRDRVMTNLVNRLWKNVYSFIFEGNSQELDHVFVTHSLKWWTRFDIVHVNVDYPRVDDTVGSDHEPLVAEFKLGKHHWWPWFWPSH